MAPLYFIIIDISQDSSEIQNDAILEASLADGSGTKSLNQPKKGRMRFSPEQIQTLEQRFQEQHYLLPADRKLLASSLRMTERQVKTWFQNKRAQCKRSRAHSFHPLLSSPYSACNFVFPYAQPPSLSPLSLHQIEQKPMMVTHSNLMLQTPLVYSSSLPLPCQIRDS